MYSEIILNYFFSFIITIFVYLSFPLYLKYIKKNYNIKNIKKIVIINSIIGWFIFTLIHIVLNDQKVANFALPVIYGTISYAILYKRSKNINNNANIVESEKLSNDEKNELNSKNLKIKNKKNSLFNYTIIILLIILVIVIIILLFVILNNHYQTIINNYEITIEKLEATNSLLNRKLDAYRNKFSSFEQYSIERNIK